MIQLALNQVEKSFSIYQVLNGVSFEVQDYERIGLVGKNGSGKTTILKMIMGMEAPDKGDIFIRKGARLGYIEQMPAYSSKMTVKKVLLLAFKEQQAIREEMYLLEKTMSEAEGKALETALKKYGQLSSLFEQLEGYEIEAKVGKISSGLQMDEAFLNKYFMDLSGGEKTRVLLGKVLLESPDILLLDEPTNHLDMHAMEWLEEYLCSYQGAVLMVAHDRYFLDQTATKIVEIERGKSTSYKGNYSFFAKEKERIIMAEFEAYEDQQKKIKAVEKAIKRLRAWAAQGDNEDLFKKAACMQKRLDKMEKLDRPLLEAPKADFHFNEAERSGKEVIKIKGVSKAFGTRQLFNNLDFNVRYGERIALIGDNGCGKSTLIKMILGEEKQDKGEISLGSRIKMAYLPQQVQFPNEDLTVLETFKEDMTVTETRARQILAKFLFYGEHVFKKVRSLSGGEKSRLLLCRLLQKDINCLILDEPTNHLDIDSRENLEEALQGFQGTVLFISHDRYFINKLAEKVNEVSKGKITSYLGSYEDYKEKCKEKKEVIKLKEVKRDKELKEPGIKSRCNSYRLNKIEEQISALEEEIGSLTLRISQTGDNYTDCMELENKKTQIEEQLEELMNKWIEMSEG